jgi:TrmH family RNA methyltransferase
MPVRVVESKQNARLKELRKALSAPGRGPGALVGIEGPKLIEEALRAGLRVKTIFVAQDPDRTSDRIPNRLSNRASERMLEALSLPQETEILHLPKKLLDQALATETPQSIAALIEPPQWNWEQLLGSRRNSVPLVIVLAGLQDPGNLGTILRSAEAFGATGVVSLPGTVSAWNAKAVRASAGSVFRVPLIAAEIDDCISRLHDAGLAIFAALSHGAQQAHSADLARPVALIIGNEGNGVFGALAVRADGTITIPFPGPVESLNAAVAASVLLYEASRQHATRSVVSRRERGVQ